MSRTYGKKGPQLSRVPGERAVQQYVLALTAALFLFFFVGSLPGGLLACAVAMSFVGLWGLIVTVRNRDQIRTVSGLKAQYVLAGLVTMFYSVWPRGWGGTAAGLVIVIVALLTKTVPAEQRTGRIEWPDGGVR